MRAVGVSKSPSRGLHGKWMQLAQDCVQCRALVLAVLNLRVLLPER